MSVNAQQPRTVLVVQRRLPHYRVPFFDALRAELSRRGVVLRLAYGNPDVQERKKNDGGVLEWATRLKTWYFFGNRLCWQPFGHLLKGVQLVVVTAENKLVYNLVPQFLNRSIRFAFLGHGANLQGDPASWRERFKMWYSKTADWWFVYTALGVPILRAGGFPVERITVFNNSVDTSEMATFRAKVTAGEQLRMREELGLKAERIGIFVGSLYGAKRVDFMLCAAKAIHERVPDFEFLVVGAGPQEGLVRQFCAKQSWAHYLGVRTGGAKVAALSLAQVMVNPGAVGLGMLDSFVCGVPMITTDCGLHGPEIAYLSNQKNGVMTANTVDAYASAVAELLTDSSALERLRSACLSSALNYSLENMVRNFADGVVRCLDLEVGRGRGQM